MEIGAGGLGVGTGGANKDDSKKAWDSSVIPDANANSSNPRIIRSSELAQDTQLQSGF
jgi:hypothetical protein